MATAARSAPSSSKTSENEIASPFDPTALAAPFALRCAALSIDYITLVLLPVCWLVISRWFNDRVSGSSLGTGVWIAAVLVFALNFLVLPLLFGQSIGKMVTGLRILGYDGEPANIVRLLLRNSVGYLLTVLSGGIGFLVAAFSRSGRTLHDILTGTVVIKGRRG